MSPADFAHASKYTRPAHADDAPYWYEGNQPPSIRGVSVDQTTLWLARAFEDLKAAPLVSLAGGLMFVIASALLSYFLFEVGLFALVLPAVAAFMLLGPLLAVGFYEVSRRHAAGQKTGFGDVFRIYRVSAPQLLVMGLVLVLAVLSWFMVALIIFAAFYDVGTPNLENFFGDVLNAPQAPLFLAVGTATGAMIAAAVFAISAVSLPMVIDREVSIIEAIATSVRAVGHNWKPMAGWAAMIVLITGVGIATAFVGMLVAMPLVGHASWHAYKAMVAE